MFCISSAISSLVSRGPLYKFPISFAALEPGSSSATGWWVGGSVSALDGGSSGHTKYDYSSHSIIIYTPGAVSFNSFDYTNDTPGNDGSNYRVEQ